MTSDYYDPDEPMNRTPPLVAAVPKYAVDEDPPPFVRNGEFPECDKGTRDRSPHYPDVARIARDDPLEVSPKRGRPRDLDHYRRNGPAAPPIPPVQEAKEEQKDSTTAATPSTSADKEPNPRSPGHKTTLPPILPSNPSLESPPQRRRFPSIHAPPLPNLLPPHERRASLDRPVLNPPTEVKSRFSVPSLQPLPSIHSPPSSSAATSPETVNNTPLPSISALGLNKSDVSASPYNAFSPLSYAGPGVPTPRESPLDRHLPSLIPPSPYTHYSPVSALSAKDASNNPSPASQPATWRTPTSAVAPTALPPPPPPAPSEPPVPQSPYEMSPVTAKSPATNYPTPTEQIAPGVAGQSTFSANMMANGVPTGVGHYKCEHPGCTAAPFQTQYLLNSHANVHSQDRPHFCPVDGCPRGIGGKGFKRKNEMMRHGLVHNSPGYVCPFCPDQQHKYPRPDNLQRHVRVHHVDKSKDDPTLRQVLAQRPIGSTRGRRRRINA